MEGRVLLRGRERNGVNECMIDASLTLGGLDREREKEIYTSFFSLCLCFGSSPLIITLIIIITIIIISLAPFFRALSTVPLSHPSLWRSPCQSDRNVTLWLIIPGLHRLLQVASLLRDTHKKKQRSLAQHVNVSFIYLFYLHFMSVVSTHRTVWDPALCNLEACKLLKSTKGKEIARGLKLQK